MTSNNRLERLYQLRRKVDAEIHAELGRIARIQTLVERLDPLVDIDDQIRAWAWANDIHAPMFGHLSKKVREAYRLAHKEAAA